MQGQTGNHRFGFPVRICLYLHDYKGLTSYKVTTKFENRGKWDGNKFKCLVKNSKFGNWLLSPLQLKAMGVSTVSTFFSNIYYTIINQYIIENFEAL